MFGDVTEEKRPKFEILPAYNNWIDSNVEYELPYSWLIRHNSQNNLGTFETKPDYFNQ